MSICIITGNRAALLQARLWARKCIAAHSVPPGDDGLHSQHAGLLHDVLAAHVPMLNPSNGLLAAVPRHVLCAGTARCKRCVWEGAEFCPEAPLQPPPRRHLIGGGCCTKGLVCRLRAGFGTAVARSALRWWGLRGCNDSMSLARVTSAARGVAAFRPWQCRADRACLVLHVQRLSVSCHEGLGLPFVWIMQAWHACARARCFWKRGAIRLLSPVGHVRVPRRPGPCLSGAAASHATDLSHAKVQVATGHNSSVDAPGAACIPRLQVHMLQA